MIKLCIFDIDGVLVPAGQKKISQALLTYLKKIQQQGIFCTVATGRGYLKAQELLKGFLTNLPLITENGARLVSSQGKDLYFYPIEKELIKKSRPLLDQPNLLFATFVRKSDKKYRFFVNNQIGRKKINSWPRSFIKSVTNNADQYINWALNDSCAKMAFLVKTGQQLTLPKNLPYTINGNAYDISPGGINKTTGIKNLLKGYKLSLAEVLFVGNDENDIPVFKLPLGEKIAVGRCPLPLKKSADHWVASPTMLIKQLRLILTI